MSRIKFFVPFMVLLAIKSTGSVGVLSARDLSQNGLSASYWARSMENTPVSITLFIDRQPMVKPNAQLIAHVEIKNASDESIDLADFEGASFGFSTGKRTTERDTKRGDIYRLFFNLNDTLGSRKTKHTSSKLRPGSSFTFAIDLTKLNWVDELSNTSVGAASPGFSAFPPGKYFVFMEISRFKETSKEGSPVFDLYYSNEIEVDVTKFQERGGR